MTQCMCGHTTDEHLERWPLCSAKDCLCLGYEEDEDA